MELNLLIPIDNADTSKNIAGKGIVIPILEAPEGSKYSAMVKSTNKNIEIGAITDIAKPHLFEVVRAHATRVEKTAIE